MMKRILSISSMLLIVLLVGAQPAARRQADQSKARQTNANNVTTRSLLTFPTQATMSDDVVWRRDIYRQINLEEGANAGLYYPVEPTNDQMNLFTCIFKLMMRGQVKVYEYGMDGNDVFLDTVRLKPKDFLDKFNIHYERTDRGVRIDNSDIPSADVKSYYLKESAYYDQRTSTFHRKVIALCPILSDDDGFGYVQTKPLFWVKYDDLAPFLAKQTIMTSDLNNAAVMSLDDYFVRTLYKGKIYKTNNMLGRTLSQSYDGDEEKISAEQKRIEDELAAFEQHIWGDKSRKDSLDSIASATAKTAKPVKAVKNRRSQKTKTTTVKQTKTKTSSSGSSSAPARVSVRRQRH